jgi:hypothetical protein
MRFGYSNLYEVYLGPVNQIPIWPILPKPYTGHVIGPNKGDMVLNGGFGYPSAGMLKLSDGSKSFGVLG